ncbi:MAG: hypothetical protein RLZZ360_405 [Candidatus Parcubacteria bacterium]|jgi:hypothetical protein
MIVHTKYGTELCDRVMMSVYISMLPDKEFLSLQEQYPDWIICFLSVTNYAQSGFESLTE